jgi:hypothetical protein
MNVQLFGLGHLLVAFDWEYETPLTKEPQLLLRWRRALPHPFRMYACQLPVAIVMRRVGNAPVQGH